MNEERSGPGVASIDRLVDTALLVWPPQMANGGDIHDVGIVRIDDDAADMLGVFEAHVLPGLAAVQRSINAVAPGGALAVIRLAGAGPNDVWIRRRDSNVADGGRALFIEERLPGNPVVRRLPYAARSYANVDDTGIALDHSEVVDAAAHYRGSNGPPGKLFEDELLGSPILSASRAGGGSDQHEGQYYYSERTRALAHDDEYSHRSILWSCIPTEIWVDRGGSYHRGVNESSRQGRAPRMGH